MPRKRQVMKMPEEAYMGISIKKPLGQNVQDFIEQHPELGYKGVADFAAEAIRLRLEEVKRASAKQPKTR